MARSTRWLPTGRVTLALALALVLSGCQALLPRRAPEEVVFYPRPPDPPRVQYLRSINFSWDIISERTGFERLVLGPRDELQRKDVIARPYGIEVWQGKIYLCDYAAGMVKVFDLPRNRFFVLGEEYGIIGAPTNIHVDAGGFKFVTESMRNRVHVFDPDDKFITSFRIEGRPADVVAIEDEIFVADVEGDQIQVLDRGTGKLVRTLGRKGNEPGEFLMPVALASDEEGNIYVSDQMNYRFQKIDRDGKPLIWVGQQGDAYGNFARLRGIDVAPDGIVYAVESYFEVVQMFDQQGRVLMAFGDWHKSPGFLELPASVAVDTSLLPYFADYIDPRFQADYLVFVTSQVGAARVGVYAFGQLKSEIEGAPVIPPIQKP